MQRTATAVAAALIAAATATAAPLAARVATLERDVAALTTRVDQHHPQPPASPPGQTTGTYYLTGYSWWDNTPPGSAAIAYPQLHQQAGGAGTYADPVTVAVGHSLASGRSVPVVPAGTRFYVPKLRRYLIVEDACGDGPAPQNGPCAVLPTQHKTLVGWLDVWVDGRAAGRRSSDRCMAALTGPTEAVRDPAPGLPVTPGPIC